MNESKPSLGPDLSPPGEENARIDDSKRDHNLFLDVFGILLGGSVVLALGIGIGLNLKKPAATVSSAPTAPELSVTTTELPASDVRLHRLNQVKFSQFWDDDKAPLVEIDYDVPISVWQKKCGVRPGECGMNDVESKIGKEKVKLQIIEFPDGSLKGSDLDTIRKVVDLAGLRMANARELIGLGQVFTTSESRRSLWKFSCWIVGLDKVDFVNFLGMSAPNLTSRYRKINKEIEYFLEIGDSCFPQGVDILGGILVVYK